MALAQICTLLTVMAVLCQAVGIFLPGWFIQENNKGENGVWYKCTNWTECDHYFKTLKPFFKGETKFNQAILQMVITMITETLAFLLLAMASAVGGMGCCLKKHRNRHMTLLSGLNVASCFIIMCGVLSTLTLYGTFVGLEANYGYSFYLSCAAAFLSLMSGLLCCCVKDKSKHRSRHYSSENKQYNDQQYYPEYQYQQQNYPMGYGGGAAPFYG